MVVMSSDVQGQITSNSEMGYENQSLGFDQGVMANIKSKKSTPLDKDFVMNDLSIPTRKSSSSGEGYSSNSESVMGNEAMSNDLGNKGSLNIQKLAPSILDSRLDVVEKVGEVARKFQTSLTSNSEMGIEQGELISNVKITNNKDLLELRTLCKNLILAGVNISPKI